MALKNKQTSKQETRKGESSGEFPHFHPLTSFLLWILEMDVPLSLPTAWRMTSLSRTQEPFPSALILFPAPLGQALPQSSICLPDLTMMHRR